MEIARSAAAVRALVRALPRPIGFVPTMGAIHAGHLALVARAAAECATVVASIFVNPLQFGPNEDFERYPRAFDDDCAQLRAPEALLAVRTQRREHVPCRLLDERRSGSVGDEVRGSTASRTFSRRRHGRRKLLAAVEPDFLYMGQKDAQQTVILKRMIADLDFAVRMVVVPTVREPGRFGALQPQRISQSRRARRSAAPPPRAAKRRG